MGKKRSGNSVSGRLTKETNYKRYTVERLAERVFVSFPRVISFSHRRLTSLRHPFLPLAVECVQTKAKNTSYYIGKLLEALLESSNEAEKWNRVEYMFDSQMHNEDLDKKRTSLLLSVEITIKIEALWSIALRGKKDNGMLSEENYQYFHQFLYFSTFNIEDLSLVPGLIGPIKEDFEFDCSGREGVTFESFAVSMLEFADNWTGSREPSDYALFLDKIIKKVLPPKEVTYNPRPEYKIPPTAFFSGGLLGRRSVNNYVEYYKCRV